MVEKRLTAGRQTHGIRTQRPRGRRGTIRIEQDISDAELRQLMTEGISIRIRDLHRSHAHLAISAPQAVSIDWSGTPEPPA